MSAEPKEQPLTFEQGVSMLVDGDDVHCYLNPGAGIFVGADWTREEAIRVIREAAERGELWPSGPMATAMGHGLTAWLLDPPRPAFLATKEVAA